MRFLGLELTRAKAAGTLQNVDNRGGWLGTVRESFTGAWQQNVEVKLDSVLTSTTVFRCISLISSDVAKMRLRLVAMGSDGIWVETTSAAFSPVLRKPNAYQNRIQFYQHWLTSKLVTGNTYVLKQRDDRRVVTGLYVLDPERVTPLVAPDGSVYYRLSQDYLSRQTDDDVTVPASEIIHDRWNTIHHPLVGVSPIYACGLAAVQGLRIQNNSANFFGNNSQPGGVLTAPGAIQDETAKRLKEHWENNYTGKNAGKIAVLGDGLTFEPMTITAVDSQLIDQLKWSAENVCSAFGVPAYKVGIGAAPLNNNVEALDAQYYAQCLQILIESIELCMDEGLSLPAEYGTEFDLDDLIRMDTSTLVRTEAEAVKGGIKAPNEARKRLNLKPVAGGNTPYLQQQNFSLEALDRRDTSDDPFATASPAPKPAEPVVEPPPPEDQTDKAVSAIATKWMKELANA